MHTVKRIVMVLAAAPIFLLAAISSSTAATAEGASAFIESLGTKAVDVLKTDAMSEDQQIEQFRELFVAYFDVPEISKFVAGRHWRGLSDEQRAEYIRLFEDYIVYVYAGRLGDYGGESLEVKGTESRPERADAVTVLSDIVSPSNGQRYAVNWEVEGRQDTYKITDIVVEGVSMKQQQRSDFGALIQQSGGRFEGLLKALRKKNEQLKEQRQRQT